jgi:hypothetical protein
MDYSETNGNLPTNSNDLLSPNYNFINKSEQQPLEAKANRTLIQLQHQHSIELKPFRRKEVQIKESNNVTSHIVNTNSFDSQASELIASSTDLRTQSESTNNNNINNSTANSTSFIKTVSNVMKTTEINLPLNSLYKPMRYRFVI